MKCKENNIIMVESFKTVLNDYLEKNNISNITFGKMIGVNEATVRKYRLGIALPSHYTMKLVLEVLGIRYHELMGFDDPKKK